MSEIKIDQELTVPAKVDATRPAETRPAAPPTIDATRSIAPEVRASASPNAVDATQSVAPEATVRSGITEVVDPSKPINGTADDISHLAARRPPTRRGSVGGRSVPRLENFPSLHEISLPPRRDSGPAVNEPKLLIEPVAPHGSVARAGVRFHPRTSRGDDFGNVESDLVKAIEAHGFEPPVSSTEHTLSGGRVATNSLANTPADSGQGSSSGRGSGSGSSFSAR